MERNRLLWKCLESILYHLIYLFILDIKVKSGKNKLYNIDFLRKNIRLKLKDRQIYTEDNSYNTK